MLPGSQKRIVNTGCEDHRSFYKLQEVIWAYGVQYYAPCFSGHRGVCVVNPSLGEVEF